LFRDARILPIYEGTNGIQAIDLVTRKLSLGNGATLVNELDTSRLSLTTLLGGDMATSITRHIAALASLLAQKDLAIALTAATPFLHALSSVFAGGYLARAASIAQGSALQTEATLNARIFAAVEIPTAIAAAQAALDSATTVLSAAID
jgi:acyl-CoA dehydrogenase